MYKGLILSLELEAVKNNSWRRTKARKAWLPDRGEHEHLVHHLDVEELVHHLDVVELRLHLDVEELRHDELLRLDEQLRLAVTSLRDLLVSQGGHYLLEWLQMHLLSECRLV